MHVMERGSKLFRSPSGVAAETPSGSGSAKSLKRKANSPLERITKYAMAAFGGKNTSKVEHDIGSVSSADSTTTCFGGTAGEGVALSCSDEVIPPTCVNASPEKSSGFHSGLGPTDLLLSQFQEIVENAVSTKLDQIIRNVEGLKLPHDVTRESVHALEDCMKKQSERLLEIESDITHLKKNENRVRGLENEICKDRQMHKQMREDTELVKREAEELRSEISKLYAELSCT